MKHLAVMVAAVLAAGVWLGLSTPEQRRIAPGWRHASRFETEEVRMLGEPITTRALRSEAIDLVPPDVVGRVTQDFRDSGADEIRLEPNRDGTWKIIATFRDSR